MTSFASLKDAQADLAFAPLNLTVLLAPYSTSPAETLESPTDGSLDVPAEYLSVGHFEKAAGLTLGTDIQSQDIEAYGEADPIRTIISRRKTTIDFSMYQNQRNVLELIWTQDFSGVDPSAFGGVVLEAPSTPKNKYYRAILIGQDDRDGREIWIYWLLPKVKLESVDNQSFNDDNVLVYKPTLVAFKDDTLGYSVAQGFAGPGWRDVVHLSGFGDALTSISAASSTETVTAAAGASHTKQLVITGNNGINYTGDCVFTSATPAKATVSSTGLVTGVASGSSVITATKGALTATVTVTVT